MADETTNNEAVIADIQSQAETIVSLTGLIQSSITHLKKLRQDLSEARTMLTDTFENEPTYKEVNEKVKESSKARNTVKQQISRQPQVIALSQKVKDLSVEVKEANLSLSGHLQDYQRLTGATEIEDAEGNINQIVYTAKLVRPRESFSKKR